MLNVLIYSFTMIWRYLRQISFLNTHLFTKISFIEYFQIYQTIKFCFLINQLNFQILKSLMVTQDIVLNSQLSLLELFQQYLLLMKVFIILLNYHLQFSRKWLIFILDLIKNMITMRDKYLMQEIFWKLQVDFTLVLWQQVSCLYHSSLKDSFIQA